MTTDDKLLLVGKVLKVLLVYHCKLNIPQKTDRGPSFAFYETIMSYLPVTAPLV